MKTIARIVERFTMTVDAEPKRDEWFLDYALRDPRHASVHLTASWLAHQSLLSVYTPEDLPVAWEAFGGMGAQYLMIEELFHPRSHWVGEINAEAAQHLATLAPPESVLLCDAYSDGALEQLRNASPALVSLDFGDLTAWRTREGEPQRKLLDAAFSVEPRSVVFTDIACRYLHLHRERYESLLGEGTCGSYGTYLRALLARFQVLYGYSLLAGYWDRWSAVMALIPADVAQNRGSLQETPDSPIGLELL